MKNSKKKPKTEELTPEEKAQLERDMIDARMSVAPHPKTDVLDIADLMKLKPYERDTILRARAKRERIKERRRKESRGG